MHWPGPRKLFQSLASPIAWAFLTDYPTPEAARRLGEVRMAGFLRRNSYRGGKTAVELLQRLRNAPTTPAALPATTLMIHAQVQLLRALQAAITDLEKLIKELIAAHRRAPTSRRPTRRWSDQPGTTPRRGRTDPHARRHRRAGRRGMRHHTGDQSLRQGPRGLLPLWAANTRAHTAITAFAHNARLQSPWAAKLYADARARGKRNPHAVRIVARAWLRVIWACWHTNTPYNPAQHRAAHAFTTTT